MIFAEEWPLMTFTLLSQLAVGTFIILMLVKASLGNQDAKASKALGFGFAAVGPVTLLALIFSLFHLGDPLGAPRSLTNLSSSWLSREILTMVGFLVLWFAFWWLSRKDKESVTLGWITALVGLAAILSMAHIYSSSVRPAWDNMNTYIAFFGAAIVMGVAGAISAIVFSMKDNTYSESLIKTLKNMGYLSSAAIIVTLVYLPIFISGLKAGGSTAVASANALSGNIGMLISYAFLLILGAASLLHFLYRGYVKEKATSVYILYVALILILVGEFIGRYLFYASGISPIIGG